MSNEVTTTQAPTRAMIRSNVADIQLSVNGISMDSLAQAYAFVELAINAGMAPKGMSVEQGVIAIVAGRSIGLNAFQSMQGIAPINGRPALWGDAMVAVVVGSGLLEDEEVKVRRDEKTGEATGVTVRVLRKGRKTWTEGRFSKNMATKAKLWGKAGPWSDYPERMLLARARAFAYRDAFADVLKGIGSAEEERDTASSQQESNTNDIGTAPRKQNADALYETLANSSKADDAMDDDADTVTVEAEVVD